MRSLFHLDEKEQSRHLELVLKNALERGQAAFHTPEELQQYRSIIATLCEGPHSEILRREVMRLFTLSESPNFTELNEVYNRSLPPSKPSTQLDAAPYLSSFFNALIAELYADPFFRQQMSDVLRVRAAVSMQRSLTEVVDTLRQIDEKLADNYTPEQFEKDVQAYTEHIERTLRYLKLVGVVPKERGNENRDPELDGIFVPLRIAGRDPFLPLSDRTHDTIIDFLEHSPCLVLLGGPGSGKSTATRHLGWSHAVANLSNSTSLTNAPLLQGKPLPLRIELRRLAEDRRQRPDYDFLTYASEVLLGRAGLDIRLEMFEVLLERRTMLVMFDGLDEVATLDDRRILVDEIESFARRYPGNRFLVTSRPVGYELAPLSRESFSHAQVQPFNDQQIHLFLEHWYEHVLRLWPLSAEDQQELEVLYTTLKDNPRLHDLAENPLLLTVITALHRYQRLPDRRILVYDDCAKLLLERWARLKGTKARWQDLKLSEEDQYACVAHLGYVLHERAQEKQKESPANINARDQASAGGLAVDVPSRFLLREIEQFLRSQNLYPSKAEQNTQARRFLDLIQEEAGLIVERGTDENGEPLYGFVHRTFQEYFAAVDVNERYLQENNAEIISEFLKEHLHDPHWREVILLLFGKLKRRPATAQLRQILDGKIKSIRSAYTDIVQQDLFFVSSCLIEEIPVEMDLAESVTSRLSSLINSSPFLSQRSEALRTLGALMQTRQYAMLARQELRTLLAQSLIADISTKIEAAITLIQNSVTASEERQLSFQILLALVQRPDLPVEQLIQAAQNLYLSGPEESETREFTFQLLLQLAQRSDLSVEQTIQIAEALYRNSPDESQAAQRPTQLLLQLAQRSDLAVEQTIQIAVALYRHRVSFWEERPQAYHILSSLAQSSDLPFGQILQITQSLYQGSRPKSKIRSWATQVLWDVTREQRFTVDQRLQIATIPLISTNADFMDRAKAVQTILALAPREEAKQYLTKNWISMENPLLSSFIITDEFHSFRRTQRSLQRAIHSRLRVARLWQRAGRWQRARLSELQKLRSSQLHDLEIDKFGWLLESKVESSDIPYIVELAQQELLPTQARNEMYQILRQMVPQFDKLGKEDE